MDERRRSTGGAATFDVEWGITEDGVFKATPARRLTHYCMNSIVLEEGGESLITKAGSHAGLCTRNWSYPSSGDPHLERGTDGPVQRFGVVAPWSRKLPMLTMAIERALDTVMIFR